MAAVALFFDQQWFTRRLEEVGRTPNDLARAMDIPLIDLAAVWKDQRELSADEVRAMAAVLDAPVADVAAHAGIATPIPTPAPDSGMADMDTQTMVAVVTRLDAIARRLDALERAVGDIKSLIMTAGPGGTGQGVRKENPHE